MKAETPAPTDNREDVELRGEGTKIGGEEEGGDDEEGSLKMSEILIAEGACLRTKPRETTTGAGCKDLRRISSDSFGSKRRASVWLASVARKRGRRLRRRTFRKSWGRPATYSSGGAEVTGKSKVDSLTFTVEDDEKEVRVSAATMLEKGAHNRPPTEIK